MRSEKPIRYEALKTGARLLEMPTAEEKRSAVDRVLVATEDVSPFAFRTFRETGRLLGARVLFAGKGDCLLLALIIALICYGVWFAVATNLPEQRLTVLFMIAPVFFMALHLISLWKEHMTGTLDLLYSCKYTPLRLTAARLFRSGLAAIALNAAAACALRLFPEAVLAPSETLRMILLSSLSVTAYAALLTGALMWVKETQACTLLTALWFGIVSALLGLRGAAIDAVIREAPLTNITIPLVLTVVAAAALLNQLLNKKKEAPC